jgi:hypothetical protein
MDIWNLTALTASLPLDEPLETRPKQLSEFTFDCCELGAYRLNLVVSFDLSGTYPIVKFDRNVLILLRGAKL